MYRIRMKRTRELLRASVLEALAQDLTLEDADEVAAIVAEKMSVLGDDRSTDGARARAVETACLRLHEVNKVAAAAVRRAATRGVVFDEDTAPAAVADEAERGEVELDEEFQRAAQARALRLYRKAMDR